MTEEPYPGSYADYRPRERAETHGESYAESAVSVERASERYPEEFLFLQLRETLVRELRFLGRHLARSFAPFVDDAYYFEQGLRSERTELFERRYPAAGSRTVRGYVARDSVTGLRGRYVRERSFSGAQELALQLRGVVPERVFLAE